MNTARDGGDFLVLEEYIKQYVAAKKAGDAKEMRRIEKELRSLGMDQMTLNVLEKEYE